MIRLAAISDEPLDASAHLDAVQSDAAGAVAVFIGQVRDHDPGIAGSVVRLDYSAHPDAEAVLRSLAERHDADGTRIAVTHRIGRLGVGDTAVVVAVATAHRAEAFRVCEALVEDVKHELPIWKKQWSAEGESQWVGL
ncbi:molybdenum cofactor biosynthesis protein MoaE [Agromyces archimandritae]|uniref:Molybdenum cofactor biosynthesis protein MoaE n=1 Tax=Agromyces archimandritae TaxID=2781962 RepID=A0A975FPM3_9MICO|nr:molybdenum cofactor biosynthesis protein MoaE [Agromyces archimandritae]QTX06288.1 molybdenum cofactor biosynthesis protein MoaE [Agromyces archimandritae]